MTCVPAAGSCGRPSPDLWEGASHYQHVTNGGGPVARTVETETGILVDLTADGRVVGIEAIGRMVTTEDLVRVLERCTWAAGTGA